MVSKNNSANIIDAILIFDIDGVLTNPRTMKVNDEILERIADDLNRGVPVALNTGRSCAWVLERIVPRLQEKTTPDGLTHLLIVAEKGGASILFEDGQPAMHEDKTVALPEAFMHEAPAVLDKQLEDGTRLGDYAFWDDGKRTMASFEKRAEVPIEAFERVRGELRVDVQSLLDKYNLSDFQIDDSVISTDVEHRTAGKHKGAEHILSWLDGRNQVGAHYYCFGDSYSDEVMAEVFAASGPSTFIYVGMKPLTVNDNLPHERVVMHGNFDADTATYLQQLQG